MYCLFLVVEFVFDQALCLVRLDVGTEFKKLTQWHAVKFVPAVSCSVVEVSLVVGEVMGYGSVKSASCINGSVVFFLD